MQHILLKEYLSFLDAQSADDFRSGKADEFLKENVICENDLVPFIFFREENYGRNLVAKSERYEILILSWLADQRTPIHDHSGQRCWMWLISGELSFKNYATPIADNDPLVPIGACEVISSPSQVYIDDSVAVHSIANASKKPALSLHLYAGPVPQCRVYNERKKIFEMVKLSYFTYLGNPVPLKAPESHP